MTAPIRDSTGFAIHQERVTGIRGMMKFANGHNYCTAYNDGRWATRGMRVRPKNPLTVDRSTEENKP